MAVSMWKCESCESTSDFNHVECGQCQTPRPATATPVDPLENCPDDLGFNWGAFFLTPIWLMARGRPGTGILLILLNFVFRGAGLLGVGGVVLATLASLGIGVYFGSSGNRIAWLHASYTSMEELRQGERGWKIAGIIVGVVVVLPITIISWFA